MAEKLISDSARPSPANPRANPNPAHFRKNISLLGEKRDEKLKGIDAKKDCFRYDIFLEYCSWNRLYYI